MPEVSFPLLTIQNTARNRPDGYLEEVLSVSRIDEETQTVYIPALHFIALRKKYSPEREVDSSSSFNDALTQYVNSGFTVTTNDVYEARLNVCQQCPFWNSEAYQNTGKCDICNCRTEVTLRLQSAKCPVGYW